MISVSRASNLVSTAGRWLGRGLLVALAPSATWGCKCRSDPPTEAAASATLSFDPVPTASPFDEVEIPQRDFYVKEDFEAQAIRQIRLDNVEEELDALEREIKAE